MASYTRTVNDAVAGDVLRSPMFGGSQATHVVLLRCHVAHGPVAENGTELEEPLCGGTEVEGSARDPEALRRDEGWK